MSTPAAVPVDIDHEVRAIVLRMLKLPSPPPGDFARADVAEWDSLKHMEIVFALEDRFAVQFDESEFPALSSTSAIAAAIRARLAS